MPPDLLPDPALGSVVRPMILQFFVLAVLWVHLVAPRTQPSPGTATRTAPPALPRVDQRPAPGKDAWSWILLPFLMISTGILFFSTPLQPVWGPLLGPGGERIPAIPAGVALLAVFGLNLGVVGWCVRQTGGVRRSPLLPLLMAVPLAAWFLGGAPGGSWALGGALLLAGLAGGFGGGKVQEGEGQGRLGRWVGLGGMLVVLGLAAWLGSGGSGAPEEGRGPRPDALGSAGADGMGSGIPDDLPVDVSACTDPGVEPGIDRGLDRGGAARDCLREALEHGATLQRAGRLAEADRVYAHVAQEAEVLGDAELQAGALLRRSSTRIRLSGLADALGLVETAATFLEPDAREFHAQVLCQRGVLLGIANDPTAIDAMREGLSRLDVTVHADRPLDLEGWDDTSLRILGACLFGAGQHFANRARTEGDSAVIYLGNAAEVQLASGDRFGRAASLQWLANTLGGQARTLDALAWFNLALEEAEGSGNVSAGAWASYGKGALLADLGDVAEAERLLARAFEGMERSGDRFGLGFTARFRAELALEQGRTEVAEALLDESVATLLALGAGNAERDALPVRLRIARSLGDTARILEEVETLLDATDGGQVALPGALPRLAAVGSFLQVGEVDRAARILDEATSPGSGSWVAWWAWSMRKAEVAALQGDLAGAEVHAREGLTTLERLRASMYTRDLRYGALAIRNTDLHDPDLGVATVLGALATGGRMAEAFGMAAELRGRDLEEERVRSLMLAPEAVLDSVAPDLRRGTTPEEVQAHLAPDEALLLYVTGRGGEPTTVFVLTDGSLLAHPLPPLDDLVPLVTRLRSLVEAGDDARGLRERLGRELLDPVLRELGPEVRRLLVIPDQGLHDLPFDALIPGGGERAGGALVEHFEVAFLPSPGVFVELRTTEVPAATRGVLALARGTPATADDGTLLSRLRWVRSEARSVTRRIPGSRRRVDGAATPGALLSGADEGYAVLHVAAHARIDRAAPARSAILLAPGPDHPAGVLRLADVESRALPFRLVVLSACSTGGGREDRGEGLRGPARAFLSAGSRSVVATSWDIGDRAAARQMRAFYAELANGQQMGAALARMKRREIAAGRPPRDWAAFQLHGDPGVRIAGISAAGGTAREVGTTATR